MLSNFQFFLKEAWNSLRRSGIMPIISLATITVSLIIFGVFLLLIANLTHMVSSVGSKVEVAAYVDRSLNDAEADSLRKQMLSAPGVVSVQFQHKDIVWKKFREEYGSRLALAEIYQKNPLPNTFTIRVSTPNQVRPVAEVIANLPAVDEVRYSGHLAERVNTVLTVVRWGGIIVVSLLIIATLLIVVNTIRLTVLARQREIAIMRLVGATDSFIKGPFLIEGLLMGIIGSGLSFVVLKFMYDSVLHQLLEKLPFLPWIEHGTMLTFIYMCVAVLGMALGLLGGYISVSRILKMID